MLYDRRPLMRPAGYTQPRRFTSQLGFMDFNVNMLLAPRVDFLAYLASPCDSLCPELRELFTSNLTKPAKPAATKSAAPTKQAASASKREASEEVEEEAEEKEAPAPRPTRGKAAAAFAASAEPAARAAWQRRGSVGEEPPAPAKAAPAAKPGRTPKAAVAAAQVPAAEEEPPAKRGRRAPPALLPHALKVPAPRSAPPVHGPLF